MRTRQPSYSSVRSSSWLECYQPASALAAVRGDDDDIGTGREPLLAGGQARAQAMSPRTDRVTCFDATHGVATGVQQTGSPYLNTAFERKIEDPLSIATV